MARRYAMTTRAEAAQATRRRILDATVALHFERPVAEIGLETVATRAETTVQTVLRHFGSRAALFEAAVEHGRASIAEERAAPAGDVEAALRTIVGHYETRGDGVIALLAQAVHHAPARALVAEGQRAHRTWVESVFGSLVGRGAGGAERLDLLVVATDVYTWKLLRRDRGLSRARCTAAMVRLCRAVLASDR